MHISTKCSVAIHCLVIICRYGERNKITSEILAKSSGVNAVTIRGILSSLNKGGIISVTPGRGGAKLNCPPEEITAYMIYKTIEPDFLSKMIGVHAEPSQECPVGKVIHDVLDCSYKKVQRDLSDSLNSITLKDIVSDYERLHEEEKKNRKPSVLDGQ